jgi:hypothetical protein
MLGLESLNRAIKMLLHQLASLDSVSRYKCRDNAAMLFSITFLHPTLHDVQTFTNISKTFDDASYAVYQHRVLRRLSNFHMEVSVLGKVGLAGFDLALNRGRTRRNAIKFGFGCDARRPLSSVAL